MDKPKNSLVGVSLEEIASTMLRETNAALDNKDDRVIQDMIATYGRNKVFCWLLGGAIRGVNPDGAEIVFTDGEKIVHKVPDVSRDIKRPLQG